MGSKILAGRYELLGKIGDGGMAVVYKAKDRLLNRNVAIKILKPEYIRDPKFIDSFRRESQAAAGLSHQNIVAVYDVGKEGNIYYIVMELLEGDTLSDVISREAPMSEKRVIEIAKQIAAGLGSAHKKRIIHRDVKPHNVMFSSENVAKIADFGIARAVSSSTIVNGGSTTVMGSVHYLSPEQAKGGYVDDKSDIYSLGIVMYEMLTGHVPFDGENAVSVAMMHINGSVPAPSIENPAVTPIMDAIVLKATAKVPGDRFASADELVYALDNAANSISMTPRRDTTVYGGFSEFYDKVSGADDDKEITSLEDLEDDNSFEEGLGRDEAAGGGAAAGSEFTPDASEGAPKGKRKSKAVSGLSAKEAEEARINKRSGIIGIILALVVALPLSIFLLNSCSGMGKASTNVPALVGMTQEQAIAELERYGLNYKLGTPVISEEYEAGIVVSTDPEEGSKVKEGYKVTLIISRGNDATKVKVPNVVGRNKSEVEAMLKAYDLEIGEITYVDSDLPEDFVVSQSPESGDEVETGTAINLTLSNGSKGKANVPDVIGMTESQAKRAFESEGFVLGRVTEEASTANKGTVISQSIAGNSEAEAGSIIDIVLSTGKKEVEPVDIPLTIDYSSAQNEVFTLTVTVTDANGLHYIVNNQQRVKSDGQEVVTLSGIGSGTVRVIMDNAIVYETTANFETGALN